MEEFPASKVHLQPDLLESFPAEICPGNTGQFGCGHKAKFWALAERGGGRGGGDITYYVAILGIKSPQTPWIVYFPASISFQGRINFFKNLSASKNLPEEQIVWGTDPLGAPAWWMFSFFNKRQQMDTQ